MNWDIDYLRKIAGLTESTKGTTPLHESWDDDDDGEEDPDVAKVEKEAKKRNIKLPKVNVDPDKDIHALSVSRKSKDKEDAAEKADAEKEAAEKAASEKRKKAEAKEFADSDDDADDDEDDKKVSKHEKSESPAKEKAEHNGKASSPAAEKKESPAEEKKEEAKAEAKRRGKVPDAGSKRQRLHAYLKANPGVKRAIAMKWAQENLDMGAAYASQQIQAAKAQIAKECWIFRHPSVHNFVLHENAAMGMYQWVSETDPNMEPVMVATEGEANKLATYLSNFKNQMVDIEYINLDD